MNPQEQLWLAAQIYSFKVVMQPDWDLQKIARESFNMAKQFFLAVQAERAGSSSSTHQTSSDSLASQDTSSSAQQSQSGSTTSTPPQSATDSTAGAESGSEKEPPADTGSSHKQSQEQVIPYIQEAPYAPYYPQF